MKNIWNALINTGMFGPIEGEGSGSGPGARRARRGIWAGEFLMPWDRRRHNRK